MTSSFEHESPSHLQLVKAVDSGEGIPLEQQQEQDKLVTSGPQPSTSTAPDGISSVQEVHQLRTATARHLVKEATGSVQPAETFPSHCLITAWIEQNVHPACSRALHDLHSIVEMQQRQKRTAQMFKVVFGLFWVVLILVWCAIYWIFRTSDFEQIESLLLKHQMDSSSCCHCCCCSDTCCSKNG